MFDPKTVISRNWVNKDKTSKMAAGSTDLTTDKTKQIFELIAFIKNHGPPCIIGVIHRFPHNKASKFSKTFMNHVDDFERYRFNKKNG